MIRYGLRYLHFGCGGRLRSALQRAPVSAAHADVPTSVRRAAPVTERRRGTREKRR